MSCSVGFRRACGRSAAEYRGGAERGRLGPNRRGKTVIDLWQRLEAYLARHSPAVLDFLNPPATAVMIREAETELGLQLPSDLDASLRIHDGQPQITGYEPMPIALVPAEYSPVHGHCIATWGQLAPLGHIVRCTRSERRTFGVATAETADLCEHDDPIRRDARWSCLTFVDPGSGDRLVLDMNPSSSGRLGQVVSIVHDPPGTFVLAPNYRAWFEQLVERYESGRYFVGEEDGCFTALDKANDS